MECKKKRKKELKRKVKTETNSKVKNSNTANMQTNAKQQSYFCLNTRIFLICRKW